jgi:tetratricopeptide (TPR) repeat protein
MNVCESKISEVF